MGAPIASWKARQGTARRDEIDDRALDFEQPAPGRTVQGRRQRGPDAVSTVSERRNRAELSHREAMALLDSERASREAKTARLRELRLAREAAERGEDSAVAASRKLSSGPGL
jgi:hypothetical protein